MLRVEGDDVPSELHRWTYVDVQLSEAKVTPEEEELGEWCARAVVPCPRDDERAHLQLAHASVTR